MRLLHTVESFDVHVRIAIRFTLRFILSLVPHNVFCQRSYEVLLVAFHQAYSYHPIYQCAMEAL